MSESAKEHLRVSNRALDSVMALFEAPKCIKNSASIPPGSIKTLLVKHD